MLDAALVTRLYDSAAAERWHVDVATFQTALQASVDKAFSGSVVDDRTLERYLKGLHLEDLALACACAGGDEDAWRHFILTFRPVLYRAADLLAAGGSAREYADAIYGELFAAPSGGSTRQSLFRYFHGRSSLATWLKAILSQRWVDRIRRERREEPLPEHDVATARQMVDPERPRFVALMSVVLAAVIAALDPRDRFRLNCYYARQLTLAQIGRLMNEHEATVSRQLTRVRKDIRQRVEEQLAREHRLNDAQIEECFATVADDPGPIDLRRLLGSADGDGALADEPGVRARAPGSTSQGADGGAERKKVALARSSRRRQP